jgi:hypothetical protein
MRFDAKSVLPTFSFSFQWIGIYMQNQMLCIYMAFLQPSAQTFLHTLGAAPANMVHGSATKLHAEPYLRPGVPHPQLRSTTDYWGNRRHGPPSKQRNPKPLARRIWSHAEYPLRLIPASDDRNTSHSSSS